MKRALRALGAVGLTLAPLWVGAVAPTTHAASTQTLTVVIDGGNLVDLKQNDNAQTKKTSYPAYLAAQFTKQLYQTFEKTHPGYTIQPITTWGWSDQLRQHILLSVASGSAPDVIVGEDFIPEFVRDGILAPLPLGDERQTIVPGPLNPGMAHGQVYAVPNVTGTFALFYNKALFRRAGLDPNTPPTTWDQWLTDSKKIGALGHGISGTAIEGNTQLGATFRLAPFMRQLGGDFTSADGSTITFNSPANLKALTFLRRLTATSAPGLSALTDEGKFFNYWWTGKVGFVVDGPWEVASSQANNLSFGVAALPLPAGGHPANVVVGNKLWAVPRLAKHQQAAIDFIKLLVSYQEQKINPGVLATNKTVLNGVIAHNTGGLGTFATQLKGANVAPLPTYTANPAKVWDEWYNVQTAALATNSSISAALATAQSNAQALLQQ